MTSSDHCAIARHHRNQAQAEHLAAHLAAEHGDAIRAREHHAEYEFHLRVATYHEAAAAKAPAAPLLQVDAATGAVTPVPEIDGLTNGPVHVASNFPSDESMSP